MFLSKQDDYEIFDGKVYFRGKKVGWIHISAKTGQVRAEAFVKGVRKIVLADSIKEALYYLNKRGNT